MNDDVSLGKPTPISILKGVGPKLSERLIALGISSVEELLFHFPLRYQDRTRVTPIAGTEGRIGCRCAGGGPHGKRRAGATPVPGSQGGRCLGSPDPEVFSLSASTGQPVQARVHRYRSLAKPGRAGTAER
jgi:hypothetical protein